MSDLQFLYLVLVALFVIQCFALLPGECVVFRPGRKKWKLRAAKSYAGTRDREPTFANPFPPLEGFLICCEPPLAVAREGFCHLEAAPLEIEGARRASFTAFGDAREVRSEGSAVLVGGKRFFRAHSPVLARHWAALLAKLRKAEPAQRDAAIDRALAEMLDTKAIEARLKDYDEHSRVLNGVCNSLFLFLMVMTPLVVWQWGLLWTWLLVFVLLLAHMGVIVWLFRRAHRALYPQDSDARFTALLTMVLSPPAAMRADDTLLRDLLCAFHPLAVARVLCTEKDFQAYAARLVREAHFPLPPTTYSEDEPARPWQAAFREKMRAALERFVKRADVEPSALLAPPERESDECLSYCPRCSNQYRVAEGDCHDCKGIALRSFPRAIPPAAAN